MSWQLVEVYASILQKSNRLMIHILILICKIKSKVELIGVN